MNRAELRDASDILSLLIAGAILGLVLGIAVAGLGSRVQASRSEPNQGIRTTLRNALRFGGIGVLLTIATLWPIAVVQTNDWAGGVWDRWPVVTRGGIMGFFVGFLFSGGVEVLRHTSLRLALALQRRLPLNLAGFLDHATRLIILRRVGGGWVFLHRLLQEHMAGDGRTR